MTANTTNSQAASIADDPRFQALTDRLYIVGVDKLGSGDREVIALADYFDAKLAQARGEGVVAANNFRSLVSDSDTAEIKEWKARATAAESRLAEIQRGVEGLTRYEFRTGFKLDVPAAGMLTDVLGNYVMFEAVEALLQPQGQADTSGLPG